MFIRETFKLTSIFLGVLSIMVIFSVLLFDKYNAGPVDKEKPGYNSDKDTV